MQEKLYMVVGQCSQCAVLVQEDIGKGPWFTAAQVCTLQNCGTFSYGTLDVGFSSTWAPDGPGLGLELRNDFKKRNTTFSRISKYEN